MVQILQQLRGEAAGLLQRAVRAALGEPGAVLGEWTAVPLQVGAGMFDSARSLYLLSGTARAGAAERAWRLVLKVVAPTPGNDDPASISYWQREALLYRSGFLDDLGGGLRAPRCWGCDERAGGGAWLWLEYVQEDGERVWSTARWARAAQHLGQFNGAYLAGRPLPRAAWLGGQRLRTWLAGHAQRVRLIAAAPGDPAVSHWWPQAVVDAILGLWEQRDAFCDALEALPQALGHGDAIRRNLLGHGGADGFAETVAIDWEYAGYMAAGEEVGQTLSVASAFFDVEPERLPELDEALFAGYLAGLRDAGWRGDPRQVRFAYCAHAALRNLFNAVGTRVPDEAALALTPARWGHAWADLAGRRAAVRPFLLQRAQEALRLKEGL